MEERGKNEEKRGEGGGGCRFFLCQRMNDRKRREKRKERREKSIWCWLFPFIAAVSFAFCVVCLLVVKGGPRRAKKRTGEEKEGTW